MTEPTPQPPGGAPTGGDKPADFIRAIVTDDLRRGKHETVATRFPPEPNGYLHIGHAKSICLNFGVAREFGGTCNLRFDDTNPTTESMEYVESIERDVRWLGFDWEGREYFASGYFEELYGFAVQLIERGKAYVDGLSEEEIRDYRGTVSEPGRPSPDRDRPVGENLELFARMRAGEFADGAYVLRAKIDLAAANMLMRDPILYRIRRAEHYRTAGAWCIYPMYDFAHCLSDALEGITHSLCTLEFENNRELYDWVLDNVDVDCRPRQIEFARLNLNYTVLSKRRLLELVTAGHVSGWDDPRMPTLSGLRRRGYPPAAIRDFCDRIGVAKSNSTVDVALLEHSVRDDLNRRAPRVLAVLRPLKVVIENYPEGTSEELEAPFFPRDVGREGSRRLPFSREIYIERDDFMEEPPPGFYRLAPGREVRLRYAYIVRCVGVVKDEASGEITELRCTYDPATRGGAAPDGRKIRGTLHWVSAPHALAAEVRLYDRLFLTERPDLEWEGHRLEEILNPDSLAVVPARVEPSVADLEPGTRLQFERHGYFWPDPVDSEPGAPVFNRIVALKDSWSKAAQRPASEQAPPVRRERAAPAPPTAPAEIDPEAMPAKQRARFRRLVDEHRLAAQDAEILSREEELTAFFEAALEVHAEPAEVAGWVVNELLRELKGRALGDLPFGPWELGELASLVARGAISRPAAKEVFAELLADGGSPRQIVEARGLERIADRGALEQVIAGVLAAHPAEVEAYRAGKESLFGFFVGQVMRQTGGKADPQLAGEILRAHLGG